MAKKTTNPNERDFQTGFKKNWSGWLTQLHPGQGSDVGISDLLVLLNCGNVTPVELKIGSLDGDGRLYTKEIRPAQIRWHNSLAVAGGFSLVVAGVWSGDRWRVFCINATDAPKWDQDGFLVGSEAVEIDTRDLQEGLSNFVFEWIE